MNSYEIIEPRQMQATKQQKTGVSAGSDYEIISPGYRVPASEQTQPVEDGTYETLALPRTQRPAQPHYVQPPQVCQASLQGAHRYPDPGEFSKLGVAIHVFYMSSFSDCGKNGDGHRPPLAQVYLSEPLK